MERIGIHCQTYGHWKDILVCAMSCPHNQRCKQFSAWREDNEEVLWKRVLSYLRAHPEHPYRLDFHPIPSTLWEDHMKRYACLFGETIQIKTEEEITEHLLSGGEMFEQIIELGREMEIQIKLVPSSGPKPAKETDDNGISAKPKKKKLSDKSAEAAA
jgi:hypothetical protein